MDEWFQSIRAGRCLSADKAAERPTSSAGEHRSLQGRFVRRDTRPGFDFRTHMTATTLARLSPLARYLLAL